MPKHMYLPELLGNIGEPPTPGVWHGYERKILRGVSDGIEPGIPDHQRGVSSVPDAWARPLMFQSALQPERFKHPSSQRFIQEWRGLLSLLALHKLGGPKVEVVHVPLGSGPFGRALTQLLPAPVALESDQSYSWADTLLIRYDGIPLGAFSPATLVYTASDYSTRLSATNLNLKDANGFLAPPAADQGDELRYVGEWVSKLHARLNPQGHGRVPILDTATENPVARNAVALINWQFKSWIGELEDLFPVRPNQQIDAVDVEVDTDASEVPTNPAFLERYRVYQEVLRPLKSSGVAVSHSEFLLTSDRNRSGRDFVVVVTPRLLQTNGRIWAKRRLSHLGQDAQRALALYFPGASGDVAEQENLKSYNAIWIRPELFFLTTNLSVTSDRKPLLEPEWQALNGDRHFLLPFTRSILDFFSPTEVRDVLRPEYKETDNGVTFSFQLPVNGVSERVQRTYRYGNPAPNEGSIVPLAVPPVEIFPRYIDATWRRYYLLQGSPDRVIVNPIMADECTCSERMHGSGSMASARVVQISGDAAFPEALVFETPGKAAAPLGLALVPRPVSEPPGLTNHWRIGIDFGTSNTNVFRDSGGNLAEPWRFEFEDYLLSATSAGASARESMLRDYFVPPTAVQLPIPTHLRVFQDARKEHPLLDYFISFSREYELPPNVHTDIKWDTEEDLTKYFLESLLFLILIEVGLRRVRTVTLACSYPKAFSTGRLSQYTAAWNGVVKELLDEKNAVVKRSATGQPGRLQVVNPVFKGEGVAAGEFFASDKTNGNDDDRFKLRNAGVCLDVGGGTTDISVWYENKIIFDASVLLAGRQISRFMQHNPRVLDTLFTPAGAKALEQKRNEPTAFAARLNIVLKKEELEINKLLVYQSGNSEIQWIRRIIAIEFGAICYYAASVLGAVDRHLHGALGVAVDPSGIAMYWGGNAAKLVNWVDFGSYDDVSGFAPKVLNRVMFNALKDISLLVPRDRIFQKQSPLHKSEAAGGLVVMELGAARFANDDDDEDDLVIADRFRDGIVCGEDIELAHGPVTQLDMLTDELLFQNGRTLFRRTSLARLKRFVELINGFGIRHSLLTEDSKIVLDPRREVQIADALRAHFLVMQDLPKARRTIEPIFILEIKILLDLLRKELR